MADPSLKDNTRAGAEMGVGLWGRRVTGGAGLQWLIKEKKGARTVCQEEKAYCSDTGANKTSVNTKVMKQWIRVLSICYKVTSVAE